MLHNITKITGTCLLLFSGCTAKFSSVDMNDSRMATLHTEITDPMSDLSGRSALKYKNGNLHEGLDWWATTGITIAPGKSETVISCINVGPAYSAFGADLQLLDFIKEPTGLRIQARAEGKDGDVPLLTVQFDDAEGHQANARRPAARIGNTADYQDYYFDLSNIWAQSWPDDANVNGAIVNKMLFFINPGGSGYTGKLFIREMQVIPLDSMKANPEFKPPVGTDGGLVDNFEGTELKGWSTGDKYSLSKTKENELKVVVSDAGPGYSSFGKKLDETFNMKSAYKLRARVRFEGNGFPELRVDAKDYKGYITNANPVSHYIEPTENEEYRDYFFIYKGRWAQAYPDRKELDPERITELLFFINPGKAAWSGTLYIEEIEVIYTGMGGRNSER